MRVYLDICCLKRPFDDQSQQRVHIESVAVLAVLAAPAERATFVHSSAHDLENSFNPVGWRAACVREWLDQAPLDALDPVALESRTATLISLGFKSFDAFHVACAELAGADLFATCDDRLLASARRHTSALEVRIVDLVAAHAEVFGEHA